MSRRQQWVNIWWVNNSSNLDLVYECQVVAFSRMLPSGMKWVGYQFSKTQGKSAFLSVSASEQKTLKIWASNSKNSQSCDAVKMANAKTTFFGKKLGFEGFWGVDIFDITLKCPCQKLLTKSAPNPPKIGGKVHMIQFECQKIEKPT